MRPFAYVLVLLLAGLVATAVEISQRRADDMARERFVARASLSAGFVETFCTQLLSSERHAASRALTEAPHPAFEQVVSAFGFHASMLLDSEGRLLAASPASATVALGDLLASGLPHLRSAVAGQAAVSSVVVSPLDDEPVIAFATPFDTPHGRRVLSGAFVVSDTPLRDYLNGLSSLDGLRSFIVDDHGVIVAASGPTRRSVGTLAAEDPDIARVLGAADQRLDTRGRFVTTSPIANTPWQLVTAVPASSLPGSSGAHPQLRWLAMALVAGMAMLACALWLRLLDQRHQLRLANTRLDDLAHRDGLTGVASRRRLDDLLFTEHARCNRAGLPLSLLMIDVDLFKGVNDVFGHIAGDQVLRVIAQRIAASVRQEDTVGRWGGEEFLVLLPLTSTEAATEVAERVRAAVCVSPIPVTPEQALTLTVSIGCVADVSAPTSALVMAADRALYAAKAAGRNWVVTGSVADSVVAAVVGLPVQLPVQATDDHGAVHEHRPDQRHPLLP